MGWVTAGEATSKRLVMAVARTIYLLGLLGWVFYVALYPPWIGRFYDLWPHGGSSSWHRGGTFGLQRHRAPLWSPPSAYSPAIQAQVRWPWQSVSENHHVELVLPGILFEATFGALVLGIALRVLHWLIARRHPDRLVCVAWSLSLALIVSLVCLSAIGAFSMGYALTDVVVLTGLGLGIFGGLVYGVILCRSSQFRSTATATVCETLTQVTTEGTSGPPAPTQPCRMGNALLGFVGGLFVAVGITIAAGWIASFFRGPIVGVWELGTPRYAKPQEVIDLTTGLGIAITGWIGGMLLLRWRSWRGLSIGLLLGATFLGILFAFR